MIFSPPPWRAKKSAAGPRLCERRPRHLSARLRGDHDPLSGPAARSHESGRREVRAPTGWSPKQVPDFIAITRDPSTSSPACRGSGPSARPRCCAAYGSPRALLAGGRFPRMRRQLRLFGSIARNDSEGAAARPARPEAELESRCLCWRGSALRNWPETPRCACGQARTKAHPNRTTTRTGDIAGVPTPFEARSHLRRLYR